MKKRTKNKIGIAVLIMALLMMALPVMTVSADNTGLQGWHNVGGTCTITGDYCGDKPYYTIEGVCGNKAVNFYQKQNVDGMKLYFEALTSTTKTGGLFGFSFLKEYDDYGPSESPVNIGMFKLYTHYYIFVGGGEAFDDDNNIGYFYEEDGTKNYNIGGKIDGTTYPTIIVSLSDMVNTDPRNPTAINPSLTGICFEIKKDVIHDDYMVTVSLETIKDNSLNGCTFHEPDPDSEAHYTFHIAKDKMESVVSNGQCYVGYFNTCEDDFNVDICIENGEAMGLPQGEASTLSDTETPSETVEEQNSVVVKFVKDNYVYVVIGVVGLLVIILAVCLLRRRR